MSDNLLEDFNKAVAIESLLGEAGFQKSESGSTRNWPKYKRGDEVLIVDRVKNIYFMTDDSSKGAPVEFVRHFLVSGPDNWRDVFNKIREVLNHPDDFVPAKKYTSQSKSKFDDKARSKLTYYLDKYTAPLKKHDYLIKYRHISPKLLEQKRFENCLRVPNGDKVFHKNALFVHRDIEGPCAYESHNNTLSGNLNMLSKNSKKALWYTDDILSQDTNSIFIGEAAIDALSFATLAYESNPNIALLSFGGQFGGYKNTYGDETDQAVGDGHHAKKEINEENPTVKTLIDIFNKTHAKTILLGNDNDEAGLKYDDFFADFFEKYFPNKFDVYLSKAHHNLVDWNDYLSAERFNRKTNYVSLAKSTSKLVIVEAGIGKFKLMPSIDESGVTYLALPPAGHLSSKMASVAMSFIHVMHENNPEANLVYTPSDDQGFTYFKKIEKWRRQNCSNLVYLKDKSTNLRHLIENQVVNADVSFLKSWEGYSEAYVYPHKLAGETNKLIMSLSEDDNIHYYHNNDTPVKMLVSVPEKYDDSHFYEIKSLLTQIFKKNQDKLQIVLSPTKDGANNVIDAHCELLEKCIDHIVENGSGNILKNAKAASINRYNPTSQDKSVMIHLASKELLRCKNIDAFLNFKKKIPHIDPAHECGIQPMR